MALLLSITNDRAADYKANVAATTTAGPTADIEVLIEATTTAETAILALTQAIQYLQENNAAAPADP